MISWVEAAKKNREESLKFLGKIPLRYNSLINIQNAFLQCYFDTSKTEVAFENIIGGEENGFSRYNFFLANYFLYKNEITAAEILLKNSASLYDSNLLLKQSLDYIKTGRTKKIKDLFNCKASTNAVGEIFYVMANLYSTQKDYQLANYLYEYKH